MTEEEVKKIPFHFSAHMSMEYEHTSTYIDDSGRLGFCIHTPIKQNGEFGKPHTHYRIDSKIFKSKEKFFEAMKDFEFDKGIVKGLFSKK